MVAKKANTSASNAKGLSLHIGLNAVSEAHYEGWSGELSACEFDAKDLAAIAKSKGMTSTILTTKNATRAKVLAAIRSAAKTLKSKDLFLLTYSGHGGQVKDVSGDEDDKRDETWCLYDGQLIDDELYVELSKFAAGVRIVALSDSCHSGTMVRAAPPQGLVVNGRKPRIMPPAVGRRTYLAHQEFYDSLQKEMTKSAGKGAINPDVALAHVAVSSRLTSIVSNFKPSVILIAGCQDNQTSLDGDHNGAFTEQLLNVWNHGAFKGSYATFYSKIKAAMPPSQTPNLFTLGPAGLLLAQSPFTV